MRQRALVPKADCPLALAAEVVADRWTMLILREAFYGVRRYDDMLADLGAPRSTLTDRLAKLVKHGLLTRQAYKEQGDRERKAYILSPKGAALATTLVALTQWGDKWVFGENNELAELVRHVSLELNLSTEGN